MDNMELIKKAFDIGMIQHQEEMTAFCDFIKDKNIKNVLEIGTDKGGTFYLLCHIAGNNGIKISVDIPHGCYGSVDFSTEDRNKAMNSWSDNVHIIEGDSHKEDIFLKVKDILNGDKLDLLFIDGDHSYNGSTQDYKMYSQLVKDGGYIAFHDIVNSDYHKGCGCFVSDTWKDICGNKIEFCVDSHWGGIGVVQKDSRPSVTMVMENIERIKAFDMYKEQPYFVCVHCTVPLAPESVRAYCLENLINTVGKERVLISKKFDNETCSLITYYNQIMRALSDMPNIIVFLCEHDVLYHPNFFSFVPKYKDTFYYNTNVFCNTQYGWVPAGFPSLSQVVCYRDILVQSLEERIRAFLKGAIYTWVEPGYGDPNGCTQFKSESFSSSFSNVDIRHGHNWTGDRGDTTTFYPKTIEYWGSCSSLRQKLDI